MRRSSPICIETVRSLRPPGYNGDVPSSYFVIRSDTYWVPWLGRASKVDGDAAPAAPPMRFFNGSAQQSDITFPSGYEFWEILDGAIQREPEREQDKAMLGMLAAIGIEKGKPFAPDGRMKAILKRSQYLAAYRDREGNCDSATA